MTPQEAAYTVGARWRYPESSALLELIAAAVEHGADPETDAAPIYCAYAQGKGIDAESRSTVKAQACKLRQVLRCCAVNGTDWIQRVQKRRAELATRGRVWPLYECLIRVARVQQHGKRAIPQATLDQCIER